jgi:hypothetical protein
MAAIGFRPVKHLTGSPYNGQANLYYLSSASDEVFVGDLVKLGGTADANGYPTVQLAGVGDTPIGTIVGIMHSKFVPDGTMNNGSTVLDLPGAAQIANGASGYVLVADSPDIVMECECSGTLAAADIGQNANLTLTAGSRTATALTSPSLLDLSTKNTTSTLVFQIIGLVPRVGNAFGTSSRVWVRFNVHGFNTVGTAGV